MKTNITKSQKKLVDLIYVRGEEGSIAWKAIYKTPFTQARLKEMLSRPHVNEYIQRIIDNDDDKARLSRQILIDELKRRLPTADNKEAVAIVAQMSKLLGYNIQRTQIDQTLKHLKIEWKPLEDV